VQPCSSDSARTRLGVPQPSALWSHRNSVLNCVRRTATDSTAAPGSGSRRKNVTTFLGPLRARIGGAARYRSAGAPGPGDPRERGSFGPFGPLPGRRLDADSSPSDGSGVRALSGTVRARIPRLRQTPGPCGVWTLDSLTLDSSLDSGVWNGPRSSPARLAPLSPLRGLRPGLWTLESGPPHRPAPARRPRSSPARVTAATGRPRPSRLGLQVSFSRALTPTVSRCVSRATMQAANHWHNQPTRGVLGDAGSSQSHETA
jgi:hypothetical protein